jgi:hypothetical protein
LRQSRTQGHTELQSLFRKWQTEKKSFREVFEQERNAYVPLVLRAYQRDQQNMVKAATGQIPFSLDLALSSPATRMLQMLQHIFEMESASPPPKVAVADFLASGLTNLLPFNVIESSMFASLSLRATAGQKKMPDQGTLNDVSIVSTLLPYCDAMFVDDGCRALLKDIPKEYKLPYPCQVFSKNIGQEFLAYLRSIRESVTPEHLQIMQDVYGPNPLRPRGIYGIGAHRSD